MQKWCRQNPRCSSYKRAFFIQLSYIYTRIIIHNDSDPSHNVSYEHIIVQFPASVVERTE